MVQMQILFDSELRDAVGDEWIGWMIFVNRQVFRNPIDLVPRKK